VRVVTRASRSGASRNDCTQCGHDRRPQVDAVDVFDPKPSWLLLTIHGIPDSGLICGSAKIVRRTRQLLLIGFALVVCTCHGCSAASYRRRCWTLTTPTCCNLKRITIFVYLPPAYVVHTLCFVFRQPLPIFATYPTSSSHLP
jgi:hypothetical protein